MFSGLIHQTCKVVFRTDNRIGISVIGGHDKLGDSIAIDGVCLTIAKMEPRSKYQVLYFDLSPETQKKTTLSKAKRGQTVNIERPLTLQNALGGHIVQGHVDGLGTVQKITNNNGNKVVWFNAPKNIMSFIVSKGSITVNGTSLTITDVTSTRFAVTLIPYTLAHTNLDFLKVKDKVNLETDIIAKYVSKYVKEK